MSDDLLLKFRNKDTSYGISRETLRTLSKELDMPETMVIHVALAAFAGDVLPAYAPDDGALTARELAWVRKRAAKALPTGAVISTASLF